MNRQRNATLPVQIRTTVSQVEEVITIVDGMGKSGYPILVEDGEWRIDLTADNGNSVTGTLAADFVHGPDVHNVYPTGFKTLFKHLTGQIRLGTAPRNAPLSVVQDRKQGSILRHIIRPIGRRLHPDFRI